jgi:hypothetical protein
MPVLEAILALIGSVAIVGAIAHRQVRRPPEPPVEEDLAAPYREGLHAAVRLQTVAQELERRLYVEAIRHAEDKLDGIES